MFVPREQILRTLYTSDKLEEVAAKLFFKLLMLHRPPNVDCEESADHEAPVGGEGARNSLGEVTLVGMWACG